MPARSKILVVDDLSVFRELEARFLASAGQVLTAGSAREALALARRERPDVVVADFALPDLDGDALCKELKSCPEIGHIPVILVTTGNHADTRDRSVRAGADDVLSKPIERLALMEAVSRFLSVPVARALVRVPVITGVRILAGSTHFEGRSRTLSRGGIFVETEYDAPTGTEVGVEFRLPESDYEVASTARVAWRRSDAPNAVDFDDGLGLQFLRMDGDTARRIEAFVRERAPRQQDPTQPA